MSDQNVNHTQNDASRDLQARVEQAYQDNTPLRIEGGNSKPWYGNATGADTAQQTLSTANHQGITNYEPTELVITARAGTPLSVLEAELTANNQRLAFEPPHFGEGATLGGTIACNLSGPARPYTGSARDFVLGCKIINGKGEVLQFGGEVMKNVAGYDVSRLMAGALGTLGVLLEVSLKVLPRAEREITLIHDEFSVDEALTRVHDWGSHPYPISATAFDDNSLHVRLSGTDGAVKQTQKAIGGEWYEDGDTYWHAIREQHYAFFQTANSDKNLWRLSLASDTPELSLDGKWLYEWGGAQRWLLTDANAETIRATANEHGGHATLFRSAQAERNDVFHPLPTALHHYHRQLKQAFDPRGIFNPGRLYADF